MFLVLVTVLIILIYKWGVMDFDYWEKRGVKYPKPIPFFGNSFRKYFQLINPANMFAEIYWNFPNEDFVGFFEANHPAIVLRNPELIKRILVKDFEYFYSKGVNKTPISSEPLLNNLFFADGDPWKLLRQRLGVAFNSGKLKGMYPIMYRQTEKLLDVVSKAADDNVVVNVRELTADYTTDVISTCGLGVDTNSLNNKDTIFRRLGKRLFTFTPRDALVLMLKFMKPDFFYNIIYFFGSEVRNYNKDVVRAVVEARMENPSQNPDYLDIMMEMFAHEKIIGNSMIKPAIGNCPQKVELMIDDVQMQAQIFILFAAGYETASSAASYTLHQLAFNPEKQEKCQKEIDEVLSRHGKMTYEAVQEMKYVEMAFKEALRMYPSIGFLMRKSTQEYTIPGTEVTIDKGVAVIVPIQAMQNDERFFDNPKEFRPERFHPDNMDQVNKYVYMPFGEGPRICIGRRFAILESVAGIAAILSQFHVAPAPSSKRDICSDTYSVLVQNIEGGIPLTFVRRTV